MTKHSLRSGLLTAFVALLIVGAYHLGKAYASGIPATSAMAYTGTLFNNGSAATGSHTVSLILSAQPDGGGSVLCSVPSSVGTPPPTVTPDVQGRFSIPLPDLCTQAIHGNPDVWVGLTVDLTNALPVSKLNAVPYAVEAQSAAQASAGSSLATQLATLAQHPAILGIDGGPVYSTMAVFKAGTTNSYQGGSLGGYTGAKELCVAQVNSPTAHMCSAEEVIRSAALGEAMVEGWYSNPTNAADGYSGGYISDCAGWTATGYGSQSYAGTCWLPLGSSAVTGPNDCGCAGALPILCCD